MEEIKNETIENENFEIVSELQNENTSEDVSAIETIATENIPTETINIDYTAILQQTNTYLNFLIFMFVLFLMLNFVERK